MSVEGASKAHLEGLLAVYKILRVDRLDEKTVVTTYRLPSEMVSNTFDECAKRGYLVQSSEGCYDLTAKGEEKIGSMMVRCGRIRAVVPSSEKAPS